MAGHPGFCFSGLEMRGAVLGVVVGVLALLAGSCAESHEPPLSSGREELDLTDDEYLQLCRWWKSQWGWPERSYTRCGDGSAINPFGDPEYCLSARYTREELPDCHITVQAWYDCAAAMPDWCGVIPDECRRPPECVRRGDPPYFTN